MHRPPGDGTGFVHGRSGEFHAEADVPLAHALENDVDAAAADHPLQAMVAVLALEESRLDELRDHREALHALGRGREGGGDARPGAHPLEPDGEARARRRRVASVGDALHVRDDRQVAPPEGGAVEPGPVGELPLEVAVHARCLRGAAGEELLGERASGAPEDADLHRGPADRLDVGVAQLLQHAHARALGRRGREERRPRPGPLATPGGTAPLTEFVLFHDRVYASRPARWSAFLPLDLPILAGESPFVEGRRVRPFVARAGGEIVARAAAVVDSRYNRHWRERLGHIVMFEALPAAREATRLLLDAACEWLAGEGTEAARAGFGMLEFPFVIDAYDALPPPFVRHNPAYYHSLLKDAGFETEKGLVDYKIRVRPELVARWESAVEAARRSGYALVPLRDVPASRRVAEFAELWSDTFKTHWGFTPFSEGEVALLAESLGRVGMLDLSLIAYAGERPVGVLWVLPELSGTAALAPGHALAEAYAGERPVGVLWVLPELSGTAALAPGHALAEAEKLNF